MTCNQTKPLLVSGADPIGVGMVLTAQRLDLTAALELPRSLVGRKRGEHKHPCCRYGAYCLAVAAVRMLYLLQNPF